MVMNNNTYQSNYSYYRLSLRIASHLVSTLHDHMYYYLWTCFMTLSYLLLFTGEVLYYYL